MKNFGRRFETAPLAEILKRAVDVRGYEGMNGAATPRERCHMFYSAANENTPREEAMRHESEFAGGQLKDIHTTLRLDTGRKNNASLRRVLVVDDERVIADTLTTILRLAGYEAAAAYNGLSALSRCSSFHPELVITDVVMPGMNGIELAILIKERYPGCKILLFSGQAATANLLEEARQSGYDFELLEKPIHPKALLAKLNTAAEPTSPQVSDTPSKLSGTR